MKERCFLDIIEYIDKIDIDTRLKGAFIEVLERIQDFFNKNNLCDVEDYYTYLKKYLILDNEYRLKIQIDTLLLI